MHSSFEKPRVVMAGVPIVVFAHNQAIVDYAKKYSLGIILEDNMIN